MRETRTSLLVAHCWFTGFKGSGGSQLGEMRPSDASGSITAKEVCVVATRRYDQPRAGCSGVVYRKKKQGPTCRNEERT